MSKSDFFSAKEELRRQMRSRTRGLDQETRERESLKAVELLQQQKVWKNAGAILFYAPLSDEIDLFQLMEKSITEGKVAALPQYDAPQKQYRAAQISCVNKQCLPGKFGVLEP